MDNNDRVLLVEGPNDKHVVLHLCNFHEEMPKFWILDKEGIEVLLEAIGSEVRAPGRKAVGILVDANDDLDARWRAVANNEQEVFSELCRIVEETIELYRQDDRSLPSPTSGKDYANKMLEIA